MSTFNPEQFLQTNYKTSTDTKLIPVPQGDRPAQISDIKFRNGIKDGTPWVAMDLLWHILDEDSKKVTGMEKPIVKQGLFLDLTPEGSLDMGKGRNVALGKVREAVGQNKDGKAWSPAMLRSAMATVFIEHRTDEKTGDTFADVKAVAPQGKPTPQGEKQKKAA